MAQQQYSDQQDAQQAQMDMQQQQQDNQHEVNLEYAKQGVNPNAPENSPIGGAKGEGEEEQEDTGTQARKAGPLNIVSVGQALEAAASQALTDTVGPLVKRLKAIDGITDPEAKQHALEKFLSDLPSIQKALKADDSLGKATLDECLSSFMAGLKSKPKK